MAGFAARESLNGLSPHPDPPTTRLNENNVNRSVGRENIEECNRDAMAELDAAG
jgi:hypothetical protein